MRLEKQINDLVKEIFGYQFDLQFPMPDKRKAYIEGLLKSKETQLTALKERQAHV